MGLKPTELLPLSSLLFFFPKTLTFPSPSWPSTPSSPGSRVAASRSSSSDRDDHSGSTPWFQSRSFLLCLLPVLRCHHGSRPCKMTGQLRQPQCCPFPTILHLSPSLPTLTSDNSYPRQEKKFGADPNDENASSASENAGYLSAERCEIG
ncbi:uncharacterized protein LOC116203884 [Punica granatum]|uniref:Uncharacterized protein LOC116203884 n=1 Tax=Punica granatum TaxID=22663 RepID=A0A6P8DJF5_PUNGR|nr:uncharacterized protein LOC116203884 [Punica granatum]